MVVSGMPDMDSYCPRSPDRLFTGAEQPCENGRSEDEDEDEGEGEDEGGGGGPGRGGR